MPDSHDNLPATIPSGGVETYRMSTDAASISKAIVLKTAMEIQGRKYVKVEGWQAIALAHGCTASSGGVERIEGGFKATGQVRRMDTGAVIAEAEGFVGEDEPVWFGGEGFAYGKPKTFPKRADYAIRAMAQTRAISRACRSAFAHVVVMMDAGLQTTPAEEVPLGGFDDGNAAVEVHKPGSPGSAGGGGQFRPAGRRAQPNGGNFVDEARRDGTLAPNATKGQMPGAQSPEEKREAKVKEATDKRIQALKDGAPWTRDALDQFWKDDKKWIDWMADPTNEALKHYERFTDAYADAEVNSREAA